MVGKPGAAVAGLGYAAILCDSSVFHLAPWQASTEAAYRPKHLLGRAMELLLWANSLPSNDYQPACLWHKGAVSQTQIMITSRTSHVPFAELPSEARALLFILALAAAPRNVAHPPKRSELTPILEIIWNRKRLCLNDLANPFRMTASLQTDLSSICFAGGVQ